MFNSHETEIYPHRQKNLNLPLFKLACLINKFSRVMALARNFIRLTALVAAQDLSTVV